MAEYSLPQGFEDELKQFERTTLDYLSGSLDNARFKPVRVPWGIYEQRESGRFMARVRLSGGDISPDQLKAVSNIALKYSGRPLHLTTRGDIQLHNIDIKDIPAVLISLAKSGLSTRGGGGNTVRNITADWMAGFAEDEVFDVSPYAGALTTRLIAENDSWSLPRKYKIAFSGSAADRAYATVSDLGFIAVKNSAGEPGFKVFAAGGMGRKPSPGILLHDYIPLCGVYDIAKAIKNLFNKYGNRKNRHAARLRFLLEKEGLEGFLGKYSAELELVKNEKYAPLEIKETVVTGRYLELPQFLGDLDTEEALLIAAKASAFGDKSLRITPLQNVIIKNIPHMLFAKTEDELKRLNILKLPSPVVDNAVACAGASTCRLGICLSRGLLASIKDSLKGKRAELNPVADIKIKISGCPNSCGQHPVADLGFYGVVKRKGDSVLPAYAVVAGADISPEGSTLAGQIAVIPAKAAAQFVREVLLEAAASRNDGESFYAYYKRAGAEKIRAIAAKHAQVPDPAAAPEFYTDWGADRRFSVAEKLEGECSAGLFDLIELDFKESEAALNAGLDGVNVSENFRRAVASASRALLITKGIEAANDAEAVLLFKDNFIGTHLPQSAVTPVNKYLTGGIIDPVQAEKLLGDVRELYSKMDDSLRLPRNEAAPAAAENIEKIEKRDFRGVKCPLNFVKAKLVLEALAPGALLEILLDDGEPIENVPASLESEGNTIIKKQAFGNYWSITVKKSG
jgi:sulfite reductase (ferredoxin)